MIQDKLVSTGEKVIDTGINTSLEFVNMLLQYLDRNTKLNKAGNNSLSFLLDHTKNGGRLKDISISNEDYALMSKCLKAQGISFEALSSLENDKNVMIVFRDVDESKVKKAVEQFNFEKGLGVSEIGYDKFMELNGKNDVKLINNLDDVELELMRGNLQKLNVPYTFSKTDEGNKVLFFPRDEEKVKDALKDVSWTVSGDEAVISEMKNQLKTRDVFEKISNKPDDTYVMVDSKNPGKFIYLNEDGFKLHNLTKQEIEMPDQSIGIKLQDKQIKEVNFKSPEYKQELNNSIQLLERPVLLKASEFDLIKSINMFNNPEFIKADKYDETVKDLKRTLVKNTNLYPRFIPVQPEQNKKNVTILKNIPEEKLGEIYSLAKENNVNVIISNGELGFYKKDQKEVNKILDETIYKDLSPLDKISYEFYYSDKGNISFNDVNEKQFVVDCNNPDLVIEMDQNGFVLYNQGDILLSDKIENKDYSEHLEQTINTFITPVPVSLDEMNNEPEVKNNIIKNKIPEEKYSNSPIYQYLQKPDIAAKKEYDEYFVDKDKEKVKNPRVKKAVEKFEKVYVIQEVKINKGTVDRIINGKGKSTIENKEDTIKPKNKQTNQRSI